MDDIKLKAHEIDTQNKTSQMKSGFIEVNIDPTPSPTNPAEQAKLNRERQLEIEKKFGKGVKEGKHKLSGIDKKAFAKRQEEINKSKPPTYKHYFAFGLPAPVPKFEDVKVESPSLRKIVELGEEKVLSYTAPFTITIDSLFYNSEQYIDIKSKHAPYTVLFGNDKEMYPIAQQICGGDPFEKMKEILELFCPGCEIQILGSASVLTGGKASKKLIIIPEGKKKREAIIFDLAFYNAIRPIIQDSMRVKNAKKPRKDRGQSEYIKENNRLANQKEQYERKKNSTEMAGMVNVIAHGGSSYIPYKKILEMNWFQFISSYETISERIGYDSMIVYKTSANFQIKDDVKHWLPTASLQKKEEDKKPVL